MTTALPLHRDATVKIRPRIFLEGNFFVDLKTGHGPLRRRCTRATPFRWPRRPCRCSSTRCSPTLQSDLARGPARTLLDQLGVALNAKPTAAQDRDSDPTVRGQTARRVVQRRATPTSPAAETVDRSGASTRSSARSRTRPRAADRGHGPDDRRADPQRGRAAGPDHQLQRARWRRSAPSRATLRRLDRELLGPTLHGRQPRVLIAQRRVPVHARVRARDPARASSETPATIDAALPVDRAGAAAAGPDGARRAAAQTSRPPRAGPRAARRPTPRSSCCRRPNLASLCATSVLLPTGDVAAHRRVRDGPQPNYREFAYALVGLAGEGQNVDGNGMYVHFQPGGGTNTLAVGLWDGTAEDRVHQRVPPPARPRAQASPTKNPPFVTDPAVLHAGAAGPQRPVGRQGQRPARRCPGPGRPRPRARPPCGARPPPQQRHDRLRPARRRGEGVQVRTAIRKHSRDFLAILGLLVLAADRVGRSSSPTSA